MRTGTVTLPEDPIPFRYLNYAHEPYLMFDSINTTCTLCNPFKRQRQGDGVHRTTSQYSIDEYINTIIATCS